MYTCYVSTHRGRGDTVLTLPLSWRRSTASSVFPVGARGQAFILWPLSALSPSLISILASVDVEQNVYTPWCRSNPYKSHLLPSWCFTSTETIRTASDGEPRTATSTFTPLLSSVLQCCFTPTETIRTIRDGEPRTATSIVTQLVSSDKSYVLPGTQLRGPGLPAIPSAGMQVTAKYSYYSTRSRSHCVNMVLDVHRNRTAC